MIKDYNVTGEKMTIRVLVWNENIHEQNNKVARVVYPNGIHNTIADFLDGETDIQVETATLGDPNHGITAERLKNTDVLLWWGHMAHGDVSDAVVGLVQDAVLSGMGSIFLHSGHLSKPFKRLMGTACNLFWREAGERERLWVTSPNHPITRGLGRYFELEMEEMYGEPFGIPDPLETVFISWFEGGEAFRSGVTYKRGAGNIFYFRPGHETYPTYHNADVQMVLKNAVRWAYNPLPRVAAPHQVPEVPVDTALEPIVLKGERLYGE